MGDTSALNKYLEKRLDSLVIEKEATSVNAEIFNQIRDDVIEILKTSKCCGHRWKSTPINSGSYYEKTKVNSCELYRYG